MEVGINTMAKARVYLSAIQENLIDDTWTKVLLDTEEWDVGNDFAANKFIAPVAGFYSIKTQVVFSSVVALKNYQLAIYKDGAAVRYSDQHAALAASVYLSSADDIYLTATQEIELYARAVGIGGNTVDIVHGIESTSLSIYLSST